MRTKRSHSHAFQAVCGIRARRSERTLLNRTCGLLLGSVLQLCSIAATPLEAQELRHPDDASGGDQTYTFRQNVEEVVLNCSVFDKRGHPVDNLDRQNFSVRDGKTLSPIVHFRHQDVPVSMALVIDDSGSMRDKRSVVRTAALDLLRASNSQDEAFVVNFADQFYLDQDFTSDLEQLKIGLDQNKGSSGGTALFDSLIMSAEHLSKSAHHQKQVVIVVTDGKDNASVAGLAEAIHRVQATNGPVIYAIGLLFNTPGEEARPAKQALENLASQTGGMAFFPPSIKDVDGIAAEVAKDIRSQYTIAFRPALSATLSNEYRSITVTANAPGEGALKVRTRRGYLRPSH